jgi:hypothetical protein
MTRTERTTTGTLRHPQRRGSRSRSAGSRAPVHERQRPPRSLGGCSRQSRARFRDRGVLRKQAGGRGAEDHDLRLSEEQRLRQFTP